MKKFGGENNVGDIIEQLAYRGQSEIPTVGYAV